MPRFGYLFLFFAITAGGLEVDKTKDEVKGLESNNSYVANGQPASLTTENNSHVPVNAGTISKSKQNVSKKMFKPRKQMKTTPATRAPAVNKAPPGKKENNKNRQKQERDTKRPNTGKSQANLNTTGLMKENIDQHIFTQSNNDFTDENKFKEFNNNLTDENKFKNSNNDSIDEIKFNRSTTKPTETSSKSSGTKLYPDVQEISTQSISQTTYGDDNNKSAVSPSYDTKFNATSLDTTSGIAANDNKQNHEVVTLINTQRTFQNDSRELTESSDDIKTTSTSDTTLKSAPNETLHNNIESNLTSSQKISQNNSDNITETPDKNSKTTVSPSETTISYLKPSIESSPKETEPKTDEVTVTIYQQTYEIGNDDPAERLDKNKYKLTTPESLTTSSLKQNAKSALKDFKTKNGAVTRPLHKQQTNVDNNLEESSYKENKSAGLFPPTDNVYDTVRLDFEGHFLHFSTNFTEYPNDESSVPDDAGQVDKNILDNRFLDHRYNRYSDLKNNSVKLLVDYYRSCNDCMVMYREANYQCHNYENEAAEFQKWSNEYINILRYGCSGAEFIKKRCCHSNVPRASLAIREMRNVVANLKLVMQNQCSKCPVDCQWTPWSEWSECPTKCDNDYHYQTRTREQINQKFNGAYCYGESKQTKDCGTIPSVVGVWSFWTPWSQCSGKCEGVQHRTRICTFSSKSACMIDCKGNSLEFKDCGPGDCCKERVWSAWGEWTNCTNDSKHPTKTRWRACEADQIHIDQPMCPQPCFGGDHEVKICCHVSWGEWSPWTQCTSTIGYKDPDTNKDCGSGCRNRTRECKTQPPGCERELTCVGDHMEYMLCNLKPCCVIPSWTEWTPWDECPQTNRAEVQSRRRWCQLSRGDLGSPACQLHGCFNSRNSSEDRQTRLCLNTCNPCVNPAWNIWSQWSLCEFQSDGTIRRTKSRTCYAPSDSQPNCQHLTCVGPDIESVLCKCDTGTWSDWSEWGNCEKQGYETIQRKKTRLCFADSNPSDCPKIYCDGDYEEKENCCEGIIWKEWGAWSHCQYGSPPYRTRTRECHVPAKNLQNPKCLKTCENWTERKDCTLTTSKSCAEGEWENIRDPCDCATNKSRSYQLRVKSSYEDQNLPLCSPTTRNNSSRDCSGQCNGGCNETCQGKTDGKYPSCRKGCNHYVMCCENTPLVSKCSGGQQYNSVCRKCVFRKSVTCNDDGYDIHLNDARIDNPKPIDRCN